MTRPWKLVFAGVLALTTSSLQARACEQVCRMPATGQSQSIPEPAFQGTPLPSQNGIATNENVINDLPAEAKLAIRKAARKAGNGPTVQEAAPRPDSAPISTEPTSRPVTTPMTPSAQRTNYNPTFNDRIAQVIAMEQNLATQTARLESKREELERWDEAAQVKFRRAFGTVDEAARQRIIQVLSQQIARNRQTMAALAEGVNLDFYLQSKQQQ